MNLASWLISVLMFWSPVAEPKLDVHYVPTPPEIVTAMLKLAEMGKNDTLYDLGCGDGRFVITALKDFHIQRAVGIDLDPKWAKIAREKCQAAKLGERARIVEGDILKWKSYREATVVTLYLLPEVNTKLKRELKPGSRVVSHEFPVGDWHPERYEFIKDNTGKEHLVYLYVVPEAGPMPREQPRVPYVPTPQPVVEQMLKMAKVQSTDRVVDLGCGDGRIVVTAVKQFGAKSGVGYDIDPERIRESQANAKKQGVADRCQFVQQDILKLKTLNQPTVVTLYLFPELNEKLAPMLRKELAPGSRIVSYDYLMGDWEPDREIRFKDTHGDDHSIYLWVIPEAKKRP
ncbi:MAG: class I SAM-dependent methyltransferase [Zavarzinella sp.]